MRPYSAHRLGYLDHESRPVFKLAAIGILPRIAQRRKKLVDQIPVRRVQLDHLKPRGERPPSRSGKPLDDGADSLQSKLLRDAICLAK